MSPDEVKLWRRAERERLLAARLAVPVEQRQRAAEAVGAAVRGLGRLKPGIVLSFYWPMKGEMDFRSFATALHGDGVRLALPVVATPRAPLEFRIWGPGAEMERGIWNIPQPAVRDTVVPDVALAPVVGFDRSCYRLGYGGGYFDRTLAALGARRPFVIGVGLAMQEIASIHPQPHDIALDVIVTEQSVHRPSV
jgi:5,10-methenyltetrahydrofolate synthetase